MKKLKPVLLAVVVGCTFAFYIFKSVEDRTLIKPKYNAVAIQIGVFKTEENARKMADTYGGEIFIDDDLYRVYYSILNKDENITFITDYLTNKGVNYYLKEIRLEEKVLGSSMEYEILMTKTNETGKLAINEELLNMYKEVV